MAMDKDRSTNLQALSSPVTENISGASPLVAAARPAAAAGAPPFHPPALLPDVPRLDREPRLGPAERASFHYTLNLYSSLHMVVICLYALF